MGSKKDATDIFNAAIQSVQPKNLFGSWLALNNDKLNICGEIFHKNEFDKIVVIGAGKASAAMAVETENILGGSLYAGLVVTKYGHGLPTKKIKIIEAGHPVPDTNGIKGVKETLQFLSKNLSGNDLVICLISGGASALWCDLPESIDLETFQELSRKLLNSGADIHEINTVRKHISIIKGGQLIKYCKGAKVVSLIISDVPGDDLGIIGSGPTTPDHSTFRDAKKILLKYNLFDHAGSAIKDHIEKGIAEHLETNNQTNDEFNNTTNRIIASNQTALEAAAKFAAQLEYEVEVDSNELTGDAGIAAKEAIATSLHYLGKHKTCLIRGGETTLKVNGKGKGGRNQHLALCALQEFLALNKIEIINSMTFLSGGTDGTDGPTNAAGAIIDKEIFTKMKELNISPIQFLNNFDSYSFFEKTGGLLITGPTQTNVMDITITLINPGE